MEEQWKKQKELEEADKRDAFRGYYKNIGGGTVKIKELINIESLYLDETYDCITNAEANDDTSLLFGNTNSIAEGSGNENLNMINAQLNQARLSIREKQELRMQQLRARETEKKKPKPKYRLGATCDRLYCAACNTVVTEFAKRLFNKYNDSSVRYVHEVAVDFCKSEAVKVNHVEMVEDLCFQFEKVVICLYTEKYYESVQ